MFFFSCETNEENDDDNSAELLIGHWEKTDGWEHVTVIDPTFGTTLEQYNEELYIHSYGQKYWTFRYDNTFILSTIGNSELIILNEGTYSITDDVLNLGWHTWDGFEFEWKSVIVELNSNSLQLKYDWIEPEYEMQVVTEVDSMGMPIQWHYLNSDSLQISTFETFSKILEIPVD